MEFKKIINIGVVVSVVVFSGIVVYQKTNNNNSLNSETVHNTNVNHSGVIPGESRGGNCDNQFYKGVRPVIINESLKQQTRELCFRGFAVLHSGVVRSPLYAMENLTEERVLAAKKIGREDTFHEELRLPANERATLQDYSRSGYDRGHLAPSDDMSDMQMQHESFSLANMILQAPKNNRVLHVGIEKEVRKIALEHKNIHVGTGIAFTRNTIEKKGNVLVPHNIWKAVYIPSTKQASAYWENNNNSLEYEVISINELKKRSGIDVFPQLTEQEKNTIVDLPKPKLRKVK